MNYSDMGYLLRKSPIPLIAGWAVYAWQSMGFSFRTSTWGSL